MKNKLWALWLVVIVAPLLFLLPALVLAPPVYPATPAALRAAPQAGSGACGTGVAHCTVLSWTASASVSGCVSPCTITYNVFRGTAPGAESATPINSSAVTPDTYTDPVTLTTSTQTFYYTIQAVETFGGVTQSSASSVEVSATFPSSAPPAPPTAPAATPH